MLFRSLGSVEGRFAEIIWQNEPVSSGLLVKMCEKELGWKKSTTYTVLKKLCEKGLFKNEDSRVTSLISKDEYCSIQSQKFVEDTFKGSLPAFIAAFSKRQGLTENEIAEIKRMIDMMGES